MDYLRQRQHSVSLTDNCYEMVKQRRTALVNNSGLFHYIILYYNPSENDILHTLV